MAPRMRPEPKPPAPRLDAEARRIVLLRALWARHDPEGRECLTSR